MGTGAQRGCRVSTIGIQLNLENKGPEQPDLIGPVSSGGLDKMHPAVSSNQNYSMVLRNMLLLSHSSCCS